MLYPSIQDLTKDNGVNRYTLVIATAKSARYITHKKNEQLEAEEMGIFEKAVEFNDNEKAVGIAVSMLHNGEFKIV